MRKGLYRTDKPPLGPSARIEWVVGEVEPFLARDTYEANRYEPPFDQLPTQAEYEASNAIAD